MNIHKLLLFMVFCAFSLNAAAYNVIAFGDSVTSGYKRNASRVVITTGCGGGSKCGGAIPYLESYLDSNIEPSNVYNWGWPGEITGHSNLGSPGGIYRINGVLNTGSSGDIVLVMEGLNDIIHYLSSGDIINNMETMINKVQSKNMYPILGLTTPNTVNESWHRTGASIVNPALAAMADRKGVSWVDHWRNIKINSSWSNNNSGDLLHLSTAGNVILAQGWYGAIKAYDDEKVEIARLKASLATWNRRITDNNAKARSLKTEINTIDDLGSDEIASIKSQAKAAANAAIKSTVTANDAVSALNAAIATAKSRYNTQQTKIAAAEAFIASIAPIKEEIANSILLLIAPLLN